MRLAGNHFDRSELAGAFGDLGTLIPFVVGYITINRLDPQGVLLGFGLLALATGFYFRTPMSVLPTITSPDLLNGVALLALPQMALTLGNAVIATTEEHNALFPTRPITVRLLAFDHGLVNLLAAPLGGVPMCRGAGGMAGHVRFGARTGGARALEHGRGVRGGPGPSSRGEATDHST